MVIVQTKSQLFFLVFKVQTTTHPLPTAVPLDYKKD